VSEIIRQMTDPDANIIFGTALSEEMLGKIRVSLLVCGLQPKLPEPKQPLKPSFDLWEFIKRHW
jgi:cell division GTPase FtsZ